MNWEKFKEYLEEKILEESSESEDYNKKFLLKDEIKTKYSLDEKNTEKLLNIIINLTNSIENYSSEDYHSLPEFSATKTSLDGNEKEVSKSWKELFPDQRKVFFGSNDNSDTIDASTFATLEAIYTEFIRPTKLAESFSEDQLIKLVAGSAINLTYETIKSKGIDKMLEQWLVDYSKLSKEEQQTLKKQQSLVSQLSGLIKEEEQHRQQQSWSWLPNWPWKDIAWYGGGGLLILIVLGWLWKKSKK